MTDVLHNPASWNDESDWTSRHDEIAPDLQESWLLYKQTGYLPFRERLVLHYSPLVRYVAAKLGSTLPPGAVDRDDLISDGVIGLIDAIEKFDMNLGNKFETYAVRRIRGQMIDKLRSLDWVPRSVRGKARDIAEQREELELEIGRPATHEEVAQHLGLTMEQYWEAQSAATVSRLEYSTVGYQDGESDRHDTLIDPTSNPVEYAETQEVRERIIEAIVDMDERSKTILVLYYLHEMTLAEIGQILGVTESRVCQLQSKVLGTLKAQLGSVAQAA